MVNGYVIKPSDLVLRTDTTPTHNPLVFSGSHVTTGAGGSLGVTVLDGKAYIGSGDELPVFIRDKKGLVDILDKPYPQVMLDCDFMVSGLAILVKNGEPTELTNSRTLRMRDRLNRLVIGILPSGNVLVVMTKAMLPELQRLLTAYGADIALLLSSDDIYINNPRNGVVEGVQPPITLQAKYYEEYPTPVVVIDPSSMRDTPDYLLDIGTNMLQYLNKNYYGTFIITRTDDSFISLSEKARFVQDIKADFVYTLELGMSNGLARGFESVYYLDASEESRRMVEQTHHEILKNLSHNEIEDRGSHSKLLKRFEHFPCPSMITKNLYVDNALDLHLLGKPQIRKLLGEAQGEALANVMGLSRLTEKSRISPQKTESYYRVNVGRFKLKLGAIELCEQLRQLGFDAYVVKD